MQLASHGTASARLLVLPASTGNLAEVIMGHATHDTAKAMTGMPSECV